METSALAACEGIHYFRPLRLEIEPETLREPSRRVVERLHMAHYHSIAIAQIPNFPPVCLCGLLAQGIHFLLPKLILFASQIRMLELIRFFRFGFDFEAHRVRRRVESLDVDG